MTPQTRVARLLCLLALSTFVTTPASAGPLPQQQEAFVSLWDVRDVTGCQQILLRVQRTTDTGPSTAAQLFLFYSVYDQCQQQPVAFGWGVIPDAGFTVVTSGPLSSPQARATLRLTVPPNSQWFTSEGPTGTIDLTFTPTPARSARFSGTETTTDTSGAVTYRIAWSEVSATVDGHLLDAVIVAGEATLGSNKSRTRVQ